MEEITIEMLLTAYRRILTVPLYHWFLFTVFADILVGTCKAMKMGTWDSRAGADGLRKHIIVLILVLFICPYLKLMGLQGFSLSILVFYIAIYAGSIMESLDVIGVPFPEFIKKFFNRMGENASKGELEIDSKNIKGYKIMVDPTKDDAKKKGDEDGQIQRK